MKEVNAKLEKSEPEGTINPAIAYELEEIRRMAAEETLTVDYCILAFYRIDALMQFAGLPVEEGNPEAAAVRKTMYEVPLFERGFLISRIFGPMNNSSVTDKTVIAGAVAGLLAQGMTTEQIKMEVNDYLDVEKQEELSELINKLDNSIRR